MSTSDESVTPAEAALRSGFFAVRVTERDHEKSAVEWEVTGCTPDRGHVDFGPYASEEEAEAEAERARAYYEAHKHFDDYGNVSWDWKVDVVPWPAGRTFSDYVAEQEARAQGVAPDKVDLRLVFDEPIPVAPPGERSRPSALAERSIT